MTDGTAKSLIAQAQAAGQQGDVNNALKFAVQAVQADPKDQQALAYLGQLHINLGRYAPALEVYYELLRLNPGNLKVRSRVRALHLRLVDVWHYPMLNDQIRNSAFERVIKSAVKPDMIVLDIGTGSGLLAMLAARAGAKHVYACEQSYPIARVASEIIRRNGLSEKITVFNCWSEALKVGAQLPEKADLLIAEIFGSSLIDEHVVRFFNHANAELLKPNAQIIPAGGTIYGMLINSAAIRQRIKVKDVCGFDLSLMNALYDEPTVQVDLSKEKHQKLSEPFELFNYDFKKPLAVQAEQVCSVKPITNGECNGIAMWFKLKLDSQISISTSPDEPATHWQQMVQVFENPFGVKAGEEIKILARNFDDRISFSLAK